MALPSANKVDARSLPSGANAANYLTASELNELISFIRSIALADGTAVVSMADTAANTDRIIHITHSATASQAYAIDISNRADSPTAPGAGLGAESALVIHNYSDRATALQIDNTRSKPAITIKNARNDSLSSGTRGNGHILDYYGFTPGSPDANLQLMTIGEDLIFKSYEAARPIKFQAMTATPSLAIVQTNASSSLDIDHDGAANAVYIDHNGAAIGVNIVAGAASAGFYPLQVTGQNYGPRFATSTNSGVTLTISKGGTGAGTAVDITNAGTGVGLNITQNGAANAIAITQNGSAVAVLITAAAGSANSWPLRVDGQNYGPRFSTTTDSGDTLTLVKNGTGAGNALLLTNKGTGDSVSINNASREVAVITAAGQIQLGMGNTTSVPAASSTYRGMLWVTEGGAGVADTLKMCLKSAADTYSWVTIATG